MTSQARLGSALEMVGQGGHSLPAEPHLYPQHPHSRAGAARCPGWSLLPPFCKEDKKEREAAFWVEFFGVWLFRFPSSHCGSKEGAALCWVCQRRRVCERDAGCREGALGLRGTPPPPEKKQGQRGRSRDGGDTAETEGTQHPGAPRAAGEVLCRMGACAPCGMHPAGCGWGQAGAANGRGGCRSGGAGTSQGHRRGHQWGQAWSSSGLPGRGGGDRGLGLPWAGMQPRGPEGSDIPGCSGSDAIPHRETLAPALTSVPHQGPGGFPGVEFNPKKHQEIQGGQSLPGEAALF